jgi:hypothetical protein
VEFDPVPVHQIISFASLQLKTAVGLKGKRRGFARHGFARYSRFRAGILAGDFVFGL